MNNLTKKELRTYLKEIHKTINVSEIQQKSKIITQRIVKLEKFQSAKCVALFISFNNEFDTQYLIPYCVNKIIAIPKIENDEMHFYELGNLVKNKFGILEPYETKYIKKDEIDLMLVPYLGYSDEGYRIGYGKGYYDKYLKNSNIYTILPGIKQYKITFNYSDFDVKINTIIEE